jgi:hypothetical protein
MIANNRQNSLILVCIDSIVEAEEGIRKSLRGDFVTGLDEKDAVKEQTSHGRER